MATWTFCRWPVDHGGLFGFHGCLCVPSGPGLYMRMNATGIRFRALRMLIYWYLIALPRRLWQLWHTRHCDVAFVQRGLLHPKSRPWLEQLLARFGPPIVYHLDDALWLLKPASYGKRVRLSERVVTGSESVAAYARTLGATVCEVEYPVDVDSYPVREHARGDRVRIGWTGARPEAYLAPALPGVLEVCRRTGARLKLVSGRKRPTLGVVDEFTEWEPWVAERKFLALSDIDIGILPLEDTELHRGKEPFKLKEYMAYGVPVVASPVGQVAKLIADGEQGYLARTPREWADRLAQLVEDPKLRSRMGSRGRALVEGRYSFERQMRRLLAVFEAAAGRRDA